MQADLSFRWAHMQTCTFCWTPAHLRLKIPLLLCRSLKHFKIRGLSRRLIKSVDNQQNVYSKTFVKLPISKRPKIGFQDQLLLIAGQKYCKWSILQYFGPLLSCHLSLRSLFCLFFSGHFTHVLRYFVCSC